MTSASPFDLPPVRLEPGETLVWRSIGADGVVAVVERGGERLIRTDNYSVLGGTGEMAHQRRQGHLPLLLHPSARRVAYVGSATGISAGATLDHPIESLRLVEIVPGVAEAARRFFRRENEGVYEDPRTRVALDDARSFFRTTDERYDLVVADLFVPWRAGTGALYTREHFEAVRAHLLPDGVFCQWLPLYQLTEEELRVVTATFLDVFPRSALFRGDFYGGYPIAALVGWTGDVAPPAAVGEAVSALAAARRIRPLGDGSRRPVVAVRGAAGALRRRARRDPAQRRRPSPHRVPLGAQPRRRHARQGGSRGGSGLRAPCRAHRGRSHGGRRRALPVPLRETRGAPCSAALRCRPPARSTSRAVRRSRGAPSTAPQRCCRRVSYATPRPTRPPPRSGPATARQAKRAASRRRAKAAARPRRGRCG